MRSILLFSSLSLVLITSVCCQREKGPSNAAPPGPTTTSIPERVPNTQQGADEIPVRESQRLRNHGAWQEHGAQLALEHHGAWVLIAGGEVLGTWRDFDQAWLRANKLPENEAHVYLYRAGVDDVEVTFRLSPFLSSDPHWVQLGRRIRRPWRLTIAAVGDTWYRDGQRVSWGDAGARIQSANLGSSAEHELRAVASNLFQHDLTLRPADARALNLGRFTAPLPAFYNNADHPCEKVILRIRIPELDIDVPAVAFVLPDDIPT